ncbi:MAG: PAS domain-containing protein [Microthrixaceae bacterium]
MGEQDPPPAGGDLPRSRAFLRSILENIPDMVFVKDARELRFVRLNAAGEELLGYSRDEMIGKNDHDLFPPEEAEFFIRKDREVLEGAHWSTYPRNPSPPATRANGSCTPRRSRSSARTANPSTCSGSRRTSPTRSRPRRPWSRPATPPRRRTGPRASSCPG